MGCSHCCRTAAGGPIGQRLGPAEMPDRSRCEARASPRRWKYRSEEHTSELQSQSNLVCRLLLEKKKKKLNNSCDSGTHSACVTLNLNFSSLQLLACDAH